jgi:hypothetical protein
VMVHFNILTGPTRPNDQRNYQKLVEIPDGPVIPTTFQLAVGDLTMPVSVIDREWSEADKQWIMYCEGPNHPSQLKLARAVLAQIDGDMSWIKCWSRR